jgi:hypothetical protein
LQPCNPLKSHKTAKALFGKAWSKTREFWRSLEKSLEGAFIPPPLAPAASGLRSSWIVIARSEVAKRSRVAFVRKRRSNEAVRPAKCGLSVRKSGWPVSSKGTAEVGAELAMTGWKLARLFLGVASVAIHSTHSNQCRNRRKTREYRARYPATQQSDSSARDRSTTALGGLTSACTAAAEEALLPRERTCRPPVQGTAENSPLMWKGTVHVYTVLHYRPRAGRGASVQTIRS